MTALLNIVIIAIVVGAVLYILNLLPIDAMIKRVVTVLVVVVAAIYAIKWLIGMVG